MRTTPEPELADRSPLSHFDHEDFCSVEPSDNPGWWEVVLHSFDGERSTHLASFRYQSKAEALATQIRELGTTWLEEAAAGGFQ